MGKENGKPGAIVLLEEDHLDMLNPWGDPVVGWQPNSEGIRGRHNPHGFAVPWVVVQKMIDGIMQPLYEQPMIIENVGTTVIAQLGERVALIRNFRMVGERLFPDAGNKYIKLLQKRLLWAEMLASLGRWGWEAPGGLGKKRKKDEDFEAYILRTAKLESLEEAGLKLGKSRLVGKVVTNPTYFAHPQYVVHAQITSTTKACPDDREIIGKMQLFTMQELRRLNETGEFVHGLGLAALALCGMSL